jgi:DNA polymerase I-like protein with 3'-5' exonuclease and polymerase domains
VHRLTASLMLGMPLDEVTDEQRGIGKTMNFALLYGMGPPSPSPTGWASRSTKPSR